MKHVNKMRNAHYTGAVILVVVLAFGSGCGRAPQAAFATPDDAAKALLDALQSNSQEKLEGLFGREVMNDVASGDATSDRADREALALAMQQSWRWAPLGEDRKELIIGDEQWPFPSPLAKDGDRWRFDAQAAREEVLARRIGRNELGVIDLCRYYVDVQNDYAAQPREGRPAGVFAQRIRSTPGHQDGLYWPADQGEESPLGDLFAQAAAEGYQEGKPSPFWGYHFRILSAQGDAAPGGRKSYLENGVMKNGFALIAYPARYGHSGVMTFMVNQDGTVYEKDLGKDSLNAAAGLQEYNPDKTWTEVPLS